jgi:hypothetical protein
VKINSTIGSIEDKNSRIFPFKVHRGKQPYDKVNKILVAPHLFPKGKEDKTAYWKKYDWNTAIKFGQNYIGLPCSGEFGFVETAYVFPITHMVVPKENVVQCQEYHTDNDSRLVKLSGFYIPARDNFSFLDTIGWLLMRLSLLGIALHTLGRIVIGTRNWKKEE